MKVQIKGYAFEISTPYSAGTVLTKGEAQALNGLRVERIQDNLRAEVTKAMAALAPGAVLAPATLEELQQRISKYDAAYRFVERHESRRRIRTLLEEELEAVASERLDGAARARGEALLEGQDREDALRLLMALPAVIEAAHERAAARQQARLGSLEDLLK